MGPGQGDAACLLTTAANELVAPLHSRMPALLPPEALPAWLDLQADPADLEGLLRPHPAGGMRRRAVSELANDARNDSPDCLADAGPEQPSQRSLFG